MPLGSFWIPVIVSTIAVFLGSSIIHMALKYHKADYKSLPQEEAVREALRKADAAPGVYFTPYCADMKEMKNPEVMEKYAKGPVALLRNVMRLTAPNERQPSAHRCATTDLAGGSAGTTRSMTIASSREGATRCS